MSAGSTSAITSSMPTSAATARAVCSLSPVRSTGRSPSRFSSAIASALDGLTVSATTKIARAAPSHAAAIAVLPSACAAATAAARPASSSRPQSARSDGRPTTSAWPSTTPSTPRPSRFANESTGGKRAGAQRRVGDRAGDRMLGRVLDGADEPQRVGAVDARRGDDVDERHLALGDRAGLVEHDRVDAARRFEHLRAFDQDAELRAAAGADEQRRRRREPECAGARDDQDGDASRRTRTSSRRRCRASSRASPTAIAITTGTKMPATRSARRCTGAFPDCASVTSFAICASAVSAPTRSALTTSLPPTLTVAPATASPTPTSTGTLSPVRSDWSTAERPSTTTPSVATFSPGRTTKRSPTCELLDRDAPLAAVGRRAPTPPSRRARRARAALLRRCASRAPRSSGRRAGT